MKVLDVKRSPKIITIPTYILVVVTDYTTTNYYIYDRGSINFFLIELFPWTKVIPPSIHPNKK